MSPLFEIRSIPLDSRWFRERASAFLAKQGLDMDPGLCYLAGVYDSDDNLVGCGGLDGGIIKCLALSEELRGQNVAGSLVSHLYSMAREEGHDNVMVFTKPENRAMFSSLGFHLVGEAPLAVMMESSRNSLSDYLATLRKLPRGQRNGVIVMNANPMTLGHLYLIREAARQCDCLTVIPVADNPATMFSYATRRRILVDACRDIPNVTVAEGSPYAVSAATFPSYFIKKKSDASLNHITLDLDIFSRHIAPALGASVRFVGSEPSDPLTALYNDEMHRQLPAAGIEVAEIPRLESEGRPVSATSVRTLMTEGRHGTALLMTPRATHPEILARAASRALRLELDLTPKPGLVDRLDSGSHRDMDHALMSRSIKALEPWYAEMARIGAGETSAEETARLLAAAGREAEKTMMEATGGVNTHRGAIFSLGLMTAAAARILSSGQDITPRDLSRAIAEIAECIPVASGTHGAEMRRRYGTGGAMAAALTGYSVLFSDWLLLRQTSESDTDRTRDLKLLLHIISSLDDSNAIFRCGPENAENARRMAADLLNNFSMEGIAELNEIFKALNISHGGAADMLALTILADSLLPLK